MIEVENLSKKYGDKLAVDDLSFTVQPGVVTGFLGPNGAGKSTTMRMIAGLDRPTTGHVRVNGLDYRDACKMGANGSARDRRPANSSPREEGADLREHHQPSPENTGHHGPGSPLNLRVRGSSPWRRTISDLGCR